MKTHQKVMSWIVDYGYMVRGALTGLVYFHPPQHYLGHRTEGKFPVVIIPGIFGRWSFMKPIGDSISLLGHPVYIVPKLGYNLFSIPLSAEIVEKVISTISHKEGEKGIILVAHSKGGLIGKYFLAHHNQNKKVIGMVSIATPYSGSSMAKLFPSITPFKELDIESNVLRDLERHSIVNQNIISLFPEYDNHVWAKQGSFLEGAINRAVPVHGHHRVVFDTQMKEEVLQGLEFFMKKVKV